jgi:hypothetical protein
MKLTEHKSKKLFYKTYLYKVEFDFDVASIFRSYWQKSNLDYALTKIEEWEQELATRKKKTVEVGYYQKTEINKTILEDSRTLRDCLNNLPEYKIRQEWHNKMFIYVNDVGPLLKVLKTLSTIHRIRVWRPDPIILKNPDPDLLVSTFADKYAYKATMNFSKLRHKNPATLNWIKNNRDKIKVSDYSLENADSIVGVYVRDEKVLMLLQMTGNSFISKIERLVLPS